MFLAQIGFCDIFAASLPPAMELVFPHGEVVLIEGIGELMASVAPGNKV